MFENLECDAKSITLIKKIQNIAGKFKYRTRANNGRSQLVAAPLSSQAKMHFLLAFYVTI